MIALSIYLNAPESHWQHLAAGSPQTASSTPFSEAANTINGAVTLIAKSECSRGGKKPKRKIARYSQGKHKTATKWQGKNKESRGSSCFLCSLHHIKCSHVWQLTKALISANSDLSNLWQVLRVFQRDHVWVCLSRKSMLPYSKARKDRNKGNLRYSQHSAPNIPHQIALPACIEFCQSPEQS